MTTPTLPTTQWVSLRHSDNSLWHRPLDATGYTALMSRDFTRAGTAWKVTLHHRGLVVMILTKWGIATDLHEFIDSLIEDQLTRA